MYIMNNWHTAASAYSYSNLSQAIKHAICLLQCTCCICNRLSLKRLLEQHVCSKVVFVFASLIYASSKIQTFYVKCVENMIIKALLIKHSHWVTVKAFRCNHVWNNQNDTSFHFTVGQTVTKKWNSICNTFQCNMWQSETGYLI